MCNINILLYTFKLYGKRFSIQITIHWEKWSVGLNNNSGGKWTNQSFLVKSIILVEI